METTIEELKDAYTAHDMQVALRRIGVDGMPINADEDRLATELHKRAYNPWRCKTADGRYLPCPRVLRDGDADRQHEADVTHWQPEPGPR